MAIVKLEYPEYPKYENSIDGKVVFVSYANYIGVKNPIEFPSVTSAFPGVNDVWNVSQSTYFEPGIIGIATGKYRSVNEENYIQVKLFNHTWIHQLGLPSFFIELKTDKTFSSNGSIRYYDIDAPELKGHQVLKDFGSRTYENTTQIVSGFNTLGFAEGYFDFSDPKKWDDYFGYTPPQLSFSEYSKELNKWIVPLKYRYEEKSGTSSAPNDYYWGGTEQYYREGASLNGAGFTSRYLYSSIGEGFIGKFPYEVDIILHHTNPAPTVSTPGVIFGIDRPQGGVYGDNKTAGYGQKTVRIFDNLNQNTTYYVRAVYKCHDYVELNDGTGELGIDTSTDSTIYSDVWTYKTPTDKQKKAPVLTGYHSATDTAIIPRIGWMNNDVGDYPITEVGICYVKKSLGTLPTISNSKVSASIVNINKFAVDDVLITGLQPDTEYLLRPYVIINNGVGTEAVYPIEGSPYSTATIKTKPASKSVGSISIDEVFAVSSNSFSLKVNVSSYGNTIESDANIYITYSKNQSISPLDPKVNLDMSRGWFIPTYIDIAGLDGDSDYYVSAVIENSEGISYSDRLIVKTLVPAKRELLFDTLPHESISPNEVYISMAVNDSTGITAKGLVWIEGAIDPSITDNPSEESGNSAGKFRIKLSGLKPGTIYSYRSYVRTSDSVIFGETMRFKTESFENLAPPSISYSGDIYNKKSDGATVSMKVDYVSGDKILEAGAITSKVPIDLIKNPDSYTRHTSLVQDTGIVTVDISGLDPDTIYYVAGYVKTARWFSYSPVYTFKTESSVTAAQIKITEATGVSKDRAEVGAVFGGTTEITRCGLAWSTSPITAIGDPESAGLTFSDNLSVPATYSIDAPPGLRSFVMPMTGLSPNTLYYFKAFAQNSHGWVWSVQGSVTTLPNSYAESVSLTETISDRDGNSVNFKVVISSNVDIEECGYIHSFSPSVHSDEPKRISSQPYVINKGNIHGFSFKYTMNGLPGLYTVQAYVKTGFKSYYGEKKQYSIEQTEPAIPSNKFSPPSDPSITEYEYTFDGETRRWRRNSEGLWQRHEPKTISAPEQISQQRLSSAQVQSKQSVPDISFARADQHRTSIVDLSDASFAPGDYHVYMTHILTDRPRFEYNEDTMETEHMWISYGGVEVLTDESSIYNPDNNSIRHIVEFVSEEDLELFIESCESKRNLGEFSVIEYSSGGYVGSKFKMTIPENAIIYSDDIYLREVKMSLNDHVASIPVDVITVSSSNWSPSDGVPAYSGIIYNMPPHPSPSAVGATVSVGCLLSAIHVNVYTDNYTVPYNIDVSVFENGSEIKSVGTISIDSSSYTGSLVPAPGSEAIARIISGSRVCLELTPSISGSAPSGVYFSARLIMNADNGAVVV